MHLRIEQTTGLIEQVSTAIVNKLYQLAYAGLDNTSNLQGYLQVPHAKQSQITYLTNLYPNLTIGITGEAYIDFEDPEVERILLTKIGDGFGITQSECDCTNMQDKQLLANNPALFIGNTQITKFNEFQYFTAISAYGKSGVQYWTWEAGLFSGCTNLQEITLPNNMELGGAYMFSSCYSLTTVRNLPPILTTYRDVDSQMFRNCTSLQTIDLSNVTMIGSCCFMGCTSLSNITSLDNVQLIMHGAFFNTPALNVDVYLPSLNANATIAGTGWSQGRMEKDTFMKSGIRSITIPENTNLTGFWDGGSYYGAVDEPSGRATYWRHGTFAYCQNLQFVDLPSSVNYIGKSTFIICPSMRYMKIRATIPPTLGDNDRTTDDFPFDNPDRANSPSGRTSYPIYVPDASVTAYQAASGWSEIASRIKPLSDFATDFPNG